MTFKERLNYEIAHFMPERRYVNLMNAVCFVCVCAYGVLFAVDSLGEWDVVLICGLLSLLGCLGLGLFIEAAQDESDQRNSHRDIAYTILGSLPGFLLAYGYYRLFGHNIGLLAIGVCIGFVSYKLWKRPVKH